MLQNKIITSFLLLLIAVGGFFGNIENGKYNEVLSVNAAVDGNPNAVVENWTNKPEPKCEWINCVAKTVNSIFKIMTIIVSPAIIFASWLLSPDWTSGDMFNLRGTMYNMWVMISNIIYFIYAILLIIIALGTIFWNEKFGYKAMLPRLALGIIMVPFTWWFVQWTISLATVVTASVITIPMETVANNKDNSFLDKILIPREITITNIDKFEEQATKQTSCDASVWPVNCIPLMDFINNWGGAYGSLLAYAYGVFQINEVTTVNGILDTAKTIWELVNGVIIWVLMFIVFGILVLALIFVLMMRAIKLWMYAIFSPLFTVHFVLGKDMLGEKMWDFNLKEFVWLCFVPAVVWLVLSFGLIIISGVMWAKSATTSSDSNKITMFGIPGNYIETKVQSKDSNSYTETKVAFGGVTMKFQGKAYAKKTENAWGASDGNWTAVAKDTLTAIGGIFGTIVIDIIALIFIWAAFMAAKWTSKAVAGAIKPFEDMGNKIWELWASLPKYTPLPIPGGSVAGMGKAVDIASQIPARRSEDKFKESSIGKLLNADKAVSRVDEVQIKWRLDAANSPQSKEWKEIWEYIGKQWGKDIEYSTMFKDLAEKLKGMSPVDRKEALRNAWYNEANAKIIDEKITKYGEFRKEDTEMLNAFKSRITSASASKDTNSIYTATQQGATTSNSFTINLWDWIKFDADIQSNTFNWDSLTTSDGKKKLEEFMKTVTEDEFKKNRPSNVTEETWKELIKKMKNDWRKFK